MDNTIDTLQIEIQAKGAKSASGIDALTTSLAALKKMVNKTLTNKLGELSAALDKIKAPITVNMNVKGVEQLKGAVKSATSNVLAGAITPTVDGSAVSGELDKISGSAVQAAGELEQLVSPATEVAIELRATGKSAGDAEKKLKEVGKSAKQGASGLSKFVSSLKRILMYRVVRSILSSIANAAKEGIQNLALYSKAIGGIDASKANATMSQFASIGMQVKNTLGPALIPVLNALMPVIQTLANWFIIAANAVNQFFATISGASTWTKATAYAVDYADSLDKATGAAKKLKGQLVGFDELNVLQDNSSTGGASSGDMDYSSMFEEMPLTDESSKLASIFEDILWYVGEIALGISAWKLSTSFLGSLDALVASLGLVLLIDAVRCTLKDGLDIGDIVKAAVGGALLGAGIGFKIGGWGSALGGAVIGIGVALSIVGLTSMFSEGVSIKNVLTTAIGLGLAGAGIGFVVGGWGSALGGLVIGVGVTLLITGVKSAMEDGLNIGNIAEMVGGALTSVAGIWLAIKLFNRTVKSPVPEIQTASDSLEGVSSGTSRLTGKLKSLVKNLALGIVVLAEVAAAAILITGAIWVLGKELEQVDIAWQPVIDNAGTVAIAMGIGVGLLAAIGVVTALLGSVGTTLIVNIALGVAILAELGVAAGLFLVEIWAIGKGLDEIGKAWQPVLDNGETIATAIGLGTALLVGIGVVTALLGVATVASAGLLPLAIGLGTAMLLELGAATLLFIAEIWAIGKGLDEVGQAWQPVLDNGDTIKAGIKKGTKLLIDIGVVTAALGVASVASVGLLPLAIGLGTALLVDLGDAVVDFVDSLVKVSKALSNKLRPALRDINGKLPWLSKDMDDFTRFMKVFAGQIVDYSKSSAISGLSATVDVIIKFFTKDPIKAMADDANNQYKQAINLNEKLRLANPELETAIGLITRYYDFLEQLEVLTGKTNNISLANGMFVSMKEVGKNLVTGFVDGIKSENDNLSKAVKSVLGDALSNRVADDYGYDFGKRLGSGIANGFRNSRFPTLKGTVDVTDGGSVSLNLKAYATGGFPDAGQMFIAREAGAEMVGNIGGRTAVANNDQIVEGIREGVISAMRETQNGENGSFDIKVYLDGKQITAAIEKRQRERGATIYPGGVLYGV